MRAPLFTLPAVALLFAAGCTAPADRSALRTGPWHMELDLGDHKLPFTFELREEHGSPVMHVRNAGEDIAMGDLVITGDSITVRAPFTDQTFHGVISTDSSFTGVWTTTSRGELHLVPFVARAGTQARFASPDPQGPDVGGTWEAHFGVSDTTLGEPATGLFEQHDGIITGTFATETGDYRYLEGVVRNDSLLLSGFDGGHAYLFEAAVRGDRLSGTFFSGPVHREPWVAVRNSAWHLRDPDSLSTVEADTAPIDLHFTTIDGITVGTATAGEGQVVVLQVMGSWCANCMDESMLFNELYARHHAQGLEMIALGFEKTDDPLASVRSLERFRQRLGIRYPIVHAGRASAKDVRAVLPMLKDFMSYPTSIVIDRKGRVRRVHTGFYGPGTGEHYVRFKKEFEEFLEELLSEAP